MSDPPATDASGPDSDQGLTEQLPELFGTYLLVRRVTRRQNDGFMAKVATGGGVERFCEIDIFGAAHPQAKAGGGLLERARRAVHLSHRGLVSLIDAGQEGDKTYVAYELVRGVTLGALRDELRRTRTLMSPDLALHIVGEILDGVDAAHSDLNPETGEHEPIVHGGLDPDTVRLTWDGETKVGCLALPPQMGPRSWSYRSPEQLRGQPPSPRTDVFAAGVLLYELLVGESWYAGVEPGGLAAKVAAGGHVPRSWGNLEEDIKRILVLAVHPDPRRRYASAALFQDDLAKVARARGAMAGPRDLRTLVRSCFEETRDQEREFFAQFSVMRHADYRQAEGFDSGAGTDQVRVVDQTDQGTAPSDDGLNPTDQGEAEAARADETFEESAEGEPIDVVGMPPASSGLLPKETARMDVVVGSVATVPSGGGPATDEKSRAASTELVEARPTSETSTDEEKGEPAGEGNEKLEQEGAGAPDGLRDRASERVDPADPTAVEPVPEPATVEVKQPSFGSLTDLSSLPNPDTDSNLPEGTDDGLPFGASGDAEPAPLMVADESPSAGLRLPSLTDPASDSMPRAPAPGVSYEPAYEQTEAAPASPPGTDVQVSDVHEAKTVERSSGPAHASPASTDPGQDAEERERETEEKAEWDTSTPASPASPGSSPILPHDAGPLQRAALPKPAEPAPPRAKVDDGPPSAAAEAAVVAAMQEDQQAEADLVAAEFEAEIVTEVVARETVDSPPIARVVPVEPVKTRRAIGIPLALAGVVGALLLLILVVVVGPTSPEEKPPTEPPSGANESGNTADADGRPAASEPDALPPVDAPEDSTTEPPSDDPSQASPAPSTGDGEPKGAAAVETAPAPETKQGKRRRRRRPAKRKQLPPIAKNASFEERLRYLSTNCAQVGCGKAVVNQSRGWASLPIAKLKKLKADAKACVETCRK